MNGKNSEGFSFSDGKIKRPSDNRQIKSEDNAEEAGHDRIMSHIRHSENKTAIRKTAVILVVIALLLTSAAAACSFIFRIKEVRISGSEKYSAEELSSSLGFGKWSNLLLTGKAKTERSLRSAYPSLDEITVRKILPDKLEITVTDSEELYCIELGNDWFTVSDTLRVTSQRQTPPDGTIELRSCGIVSAVVGEYIVFDRDTHYNYLKNLLECIRAHNISEHIVRVDMSEKFDVKLKYDDRFIIEIGDASNASTKLTLAEAYIASLKDGDRGIIYATNLENGSFRATDDIE